MPTVSSGTVGRNCSSSSADPLIIDGGMVFGRHSCM